jgi:hypothetical protein
MAEQQARRQKQRGRFGQDMDKHNEAIRRLIVVGRTCLDSIAQSVTDEKLRNDSRTALRSLGMAAKA